MMEELFKGFFYLIFNFIGGCVRWVYGSIWRTIFRKPKFTFKEYLFGPKSPDYYDELTHQGFNTLIGVLFLFFLIWVFSNL